MAPGELAVVGTDEHAACHAWRGYVCSGIKVGPNHAMQELTKTAQRIKAQEMLELHYVVNHVCCLLSTHIKRDIRMQRKLLD